jgi:hypothetical protein
MRKIKPLKSVLCTVLVISMTLFTGVSTFAENDTNTDACRNTAVKISTDSHKEYLEDAVIKLVQEGKLSKDKAERILEYKKKRTEELSKLTKEQRHQMKMQGSKGSFLKDIIQQGIITEAEAQMIKGKLREMKDARLTDGMQGLVERGVLTSTDIENMRSYMLKVREERKTNIEKLKSMTPEKREEYFRENKKGRKDIITNMIEDKVITEKQAEEIRKAIPELNRKYHNKSKENPVLQ